MIFKFLIAKIKRILNEEHKGHLEALPEWIKKRELEGKQKKEQRDLIYKEFKLFCEKENHKSTIEILKDLLELDDLKQPKRKDYKDFNEYDEKKREYDKKTDVFYTKTNLSVKMITDLVDNPCKRLKMYTLMSIIRGYELNECKAKELLNSVGVTLKPINDINKAYMFLINISKTLHYSDLLSSYDNDIIELDNDILLSILIHNNYIAKEANKKNGESYFLGQKYRNQINKNL